jgi:hypothetical protein
MSSKKSYIFMSYTHTHTHKYISKDMLINSITNLQLTRGVSFFFADTWRAASRLLRNSCWVDEERLDAAAVLLSCKPPRKGAVLADTCELLLVLQEEEVTEGP